jgi:hypothetical protein
MPLLGHLKVLVSIAGANLNFSFMQQIPMP